jgi:hypothetical protein
MDDEQRRKLYALQNIIEQQRGTGQISRAEAAEKMAGLSRGSNSDLYEYGDADEYAVRTYGPESDGDRALDRLKADRESRPETQSDISLDKDGAYEESRREEDTDVDYANERSVSDFLSQPEDPSLLRIMQEVDEDRTGPEKKKRKFNVLESKDN